ncbi:MAG: hypothetical protein M1828_000308 [Chrysothrix sp. TS-e1954]|nr:MAG: hypothetical protein M1828_000308 [Chrysothrix sp. TS-e1954]
MFGAFRPTLTRLSGLLWKRPWRLSPAQKRRQRKRLKLVDNVVTTVHDSLAKQSMKLKSVERWNAEMPREEEMLPKDKYSMFDRKAKRYRKGVHSMYPMMLWKNILLVNGGLTRHFAELPKWTRVSQRLNPPGF